MSDTPIDTPTDPYAEVKALKKKTGLQAAEIAKHLGAKGVNPAIVSQCLRDGKLPSPDDLRMAIKKAHEAKQAELESELKF